jgi:SAM-dependent methyltransferase
MDERLEEVRARLLVMSESAAADGVPLRWFEELYAGADGDWKEIPWANMQPNPVMMQWLSEYEIAGEASGGSFGPPVSRRVLVIGCGLGDDAVVLAETGFKVTAFDISETCIDWCRDRFPDSEVDWQVADLLKPSESWREAFDMVIEIHTLQAIPEEVRLEAAPIITTLLAPGGHLLCIGRLDDGGEPAVPPPPWPLRRDWLEQVFSDLESVGFREYVEEDTPGVLRYVAGWIRPIATT